MFSTFGRKQLQVLSWWAGPQASRYQAIICDGAVRSGKTSVLALSFVLWAMERFQGASFAICGQTVGAARRNIIDPMRETLSGLFTLRERRSEGYLEISGGGVSNRFYLFGGKDEGSAGLIQGMTLAGVLLDEVALMPRSFVEQALARCSVEDARFWFSCNPQGPGHWFYREWICKAAERKALRLHFTMADNPSLSEQVRERYRALYSGVFYQRYVLGEWVAAQGLVYEGFGEKNLTATLPEQFEAHWISCDYGTRNPCSMGLWGKKDGVWYRIREYYHDGRKNGMRTDEEYYQALCELAGDWPVNRVVVDPSAASFIQCIRSHGRFTVRPARNKVLPGIRHVTQMLSEGKLVVWEGCRDSIREFGEYRWMDGPEDQPVKENDHAMDDIRYFVETVVFGGGFSFQ